MVRSRTGSVVSEDSHGAGVPVRPRAPPRSDKSALAGKGARSRSTSMPAAEIATVAAALPGAGSHNNNSNTNGNHNVGVIMGNTSPPASTEPVAPPQRVDYRTVFRSYNGDKFSTRGDYWNGCVYMSRMAGSSDVANVLMPHLTPHPAVATAADETPTDLPLPGPLEDESVIVSATKRRCAAALRNLSFNAGSEEKMASDGAVQALIDLSVLEDVETQMHCAAALRNVSCDQSVMPDIVRQGAVKALVVLAGSANTNVKQDVAVALCNVLACKHVHVGVLLAGGLHCIKSLAACDDDTTRTHVAAAMYNLSCYKDDFPRLVEAGIMKGLVDIAQQSRSHDPRRYAIRALSLLSCFRVCRAKLLEEDIIPHLAMFVAAADTAEDPQEAEHLKQHLAVSISNLAQHRSSLPRILAGGGIRTLVRTFEAAKDASTRCMVGTALSDLCEYSEAHDQIAEENGIPAIIELAASTDENIRIKAAAAVCNLSLSKLIRPALIAAGVITALYSVAESSLIEAKRICAVALCNLVSDVPAADQSAVQSRAMRALVSLALCSSLREREQCAQVMAELSEHAVLRDAMVQEAALPVLRSILPSGSVRLQQFCLATLVNLSKCPAARPALIFGHPDDPSGSFVSELAALQLGDEATTIPLLVASVLSNLAAYPEGRSRLVADGIVHVLGRLYSHSDPKTRVQVAWSLCRLAQCEDCRATMASHGAIKVLVALAQSSSEQVKPACALALHRLSCWSGAEQAFVDGGAVLLLMITALFRSDDVSTKLLCASALYNLMCSDRSRAKVVEEGVVWALIKLAEDDNEHLKQLCARTVSNLLCEQQFRKIVLENKGLTALVTMSQSESPLTQRWCAMAMRCLTWEPELRAKLVEAGVIGPLTKLCVNSGSDDEIRVAAAEALAFLSFHESGRRSLVERDACSSLSVLCRFQKDNALLLYFIATTLHNMSTVPGALPKLLQQSILAAFSVLCTASMPAIVELAAKGVYNLTTDPECCHKLMSNSVFRSTVMYLAESRSSEPKIWVTRCLAAMSWYMECQTAMVDWKVVDIINRHLLQAPDMPPGTNTPHWLCATTILCNMTRHAAHHAGILAQGIIPTLLHVHEVIGKPVQPMLARALRNLLNNPLEISLEEVVAVIPTLVTLAMEAPAEPEDASRVTQMQDCAVAARDLCMRPECHESLLSHGMVRALIRMAELGGEGTKHSCSVAMCNLSHRRNLSGLLVRDGLVPALVALSKSTSEDTKRRCAVALRNLTSHEDVQSQLMGEGVVSALLSLMQTQDSDATAMSVRRSSVDSLLLLAPLISGVVQRTEVSEPVTFDSEEVDAMIKRLPTLVIGRKLVRVPAAEWIKDVHVAGGTQFDDDHTAAQPVADRGAYETEPVINVTSLLTSERHDEADDEARWTYVTHLFPCEFLTFQQKRGVDIVQDRREGMERRGVTPRSAMVLLGTEPDFSAESSLGLPPPLPSAHSPLDRRVSGGLFQLDRLAYLMQRNKNRGSMRSIGRIGSSSNVAQDPTPSPKKKTSGNKSHRRIVLDPTASASPRALQPQPPPSQMSVMPPEPEPDVPAKTVYTLKARSATGPPAAFQAAKASLRATDGPVSPVVNATSPKAGMQVLPLLSPPLSPPTDQEVVIASSHLTSRRRRTKSTNAMIKSHSGKGSDWQTLRQTDRLLSPITTPQDPEDEDVSAVSVREPSPPAAPKDRPHRKRPIVSPFLAKLVPR